MKWSGEKVKSVWTKYLRSEQVEEKSGRAEIGLKKNLAHYGSVMCDC